MLRLNADDRRVLTLLFPDGSVIVEPTNGGLEARLQELAA
jgi:hypothetical protein